MHLDDPHNNCCSVALLLPKPRTAFSSFSAIFRLTPVFAEIFCMSRRWLQRTGSALTRLKASFPRSPSFLAAGFLTVSSGGGLFLRRTLFVFPPSDLFFLADPRRNDKKARTSSLSCRRNSYFVIFFPTTCSPGSVVLRFPPTGARTPSRSGLAGPAQANCRLCLLQDFPLPSLHQRKRQPPFVRKTLPPPKCRTNHPGLLLTFD